MLLTPVIVEACICLLLTMTDIGRVVMLERGWVAPGCGQEPVSASVGLRLWPAVAWPGSPVSGGPLTSVHTCSMLARGTHDDMSSKFWALNADTPWHLVSIQTSRRLETLCRIDFYLFAVMTV